MSDQFKQQFDGVLDELVHRKWIKAWGRGPKGDIAIQFTELGSERWKWLRILKKELGTDEFVGKVAGIAAIGSFQSEKNPPSDAEKRF